VVHLYGINKKVDNFYAYDNSIHVILQEKTLLSHLERSFVLLRPWLIHFGLRARNGIDNYDRERIDYLWQELFQTEQFMAFGANNTRLWWSRGALSTMLSLFKKIWERAGEKTTKSGKTTMMFIAFRTYCSLREKQEDFSGGVAFAEEGYKLVVEVYEPVHLLQVQEAAGILINVLIGNRNLKDARMLKDLQKWRIWISEIKRMGWIKIAKGAHNLADIIVQQMKGKFDRFISLDAKEKEGSHIYVFMYIYIYVQIHICICM
jgi:hypothetical protein